jgi:curved DNA-binding protein CbpA
MRNRRNFYRILQVQADAPVEVLKASYRTIMQRLRVHPDLGGDPEHAALINEAFATLSDPTRRAEYDRRLKPHERERHRQAEAASAQPPPRPAPALAPGNRTAEPPTPLPSCSFCHASCTTAEAYWHEHACSTCGSPLFPATRHHDGEDTRRAIGRVPQHMPLDFWLPTSAHQRRRGTTEDLSLNGMRFLSPTEIPIGTRVRIECRFCSAVAVAKSIRRNPGLPFGRWQCGVEFLTLRLHHERGGLFSTVA